MYNMKDPVLVYLQPRTLSEKQYKEDFEEIIANSNYYLDEVSKTDEKMMQVEIEWLICPKNKSESDKHVIYMYDKPWRSQKV